MDSETIYSAIQSLLCLLVILWVVFWGLPGYRLDRYRQSLFEIRDRLFDYAAAGNVSFDHDAYGMLRSTINGFIRFAHRISLSQIVLLIILARWDRQRVTHSFGDRWIKNTEGLPDDVREQLNSFLRDVNYQTARHALGYFADILSYGVRSVCVAASFRDRARRFLKDVRDDIDTTAFAWR